MKKLLKILAAAGIAALVAIPAEVGAVWGPGWGPWRNNHIYDPAYRFGPPWQRNYIRDLYLHGPGYAHWRQLRRLY